MKVKTHKRQSQAKVSYKVKGQASTSFKFDSQDFKEVLIRGPKRSLGGVGG